jgi:hypothetical protein
MSVFDTPTGIYWRKTNELRFVTRILPETQSKVKILQQMMQSSFGELVWEDVPLVEED